MQRSKRFLTVLMLVIFVASVFPVQAAAAEVEIIELTLEECLELAQENSPRLKLAAVSLDQAKLGLKEAKSGKRKLDEAKEEAKEFGVSIRASSVDEAFLMDHSVWMAEEQLALAQASFDLAGEGVRLAVIMAYQDLLKAEAGLAAARAAEAETAELQRVTKAQARVGMASPVQELQADTALAQARAGRLAAESNREAKRLGLLKELGLDLSTEVRLAPLPVEVVEFDLEQLVQDALGKSVEIRAVAFQQEIAARKFDITKRWYPEITYQYKGAEYEALTKELELIDVRINVETGVRSSYNQLLAALEQLAPAERAVEQAEEALRVVQAKLKVGAATGLEVLQAQRALAQAKSNVTTTQGNYILAAASLKAAALGLTTTVSSGQGLQEVQGSDELQRQVQGHYAGSHASLRPGGV
jgi:outer membrane protein TolC